MREIMETHWGEDAIPSETESLIVWHSRRGGLLFNREGMCMASSPWWEEAT